MKWYYYKLVDFNGWTKVGAFHCKSQSEAFTKLISTGQRFVTVKFSKECCL